MHRSHRLATAAPLAAAIAACIVALPVRAADAVTNEAGPSAAVPAVDLDRVEVVGEREYHYVERRTTASTRTDTPLLEVPQAITVVTSDLIDDTAMRGLGDVVQYVPGAGMAQGRAIAMPPSCAATPRQPTSSSTGCAMTCSTSATSTTSSGWRC